MTARPELSACARSGDEPLEIATDCASAPVIAAEADVSVWADREYRHSDDAELSGCRFRHPADLRAIGACAEPVDLCDERAPLSGELRDQVANPARFGLGAAEDEQRMTRIVGEFMKGAGITVRGPDRDRVWQQPAWRNDRAVVTCDGA